MNRVLDRLFSILDARINSSCLIDIGDDSIVKSSIFTLVHPNYLNMLLAYSRRNALFFFFFIAHFIAFSQSNSSEITGRLLSESGEPIAFATIAVFKEDSTLVKGEVSNIEGQFLILNVRPGNFYAKVQSLEYETYYRSFSLENGEKLNLGTIQLSSGSIQLESVTVSTQRQLVEVLPDRMVFNVESSVNSSGLNGLELLRQAPGVLVDPDNNILLQGKSGVRIFINGRPSRLSGTDLATLLESMQSDNIELIELITNPSSRYEAEGNAGIINIKLKNNINLGYNGSIIHSYTKGDAPRMNNSASINYGKGKIGATATIARFDNVFEEQYIDRKIQSGFDIDSDSKESRDRSGYNINTSITYTMNPKHSINVSGGSVLTTGDYDAISNTSIEDLADPSAGEFLEAKSLTNYTSSNYNVNLNYLWNISESSSFNSDVSYGSFEKDNRIDQPNTYFESDRETVIREVNNAFDPFTNIDIYSIKADYSKSMDRVNLSTGMKYYEVLTENEFIVSDIVNGIETVNTALSNTFNYSERVGAAYVTGDFKLSEKLSASVGARVEHTTSEGILESDQNTGNDNVKRNYTNLFPNIGIAYKRKKSEVSVGYGKRISRPNYQDLNPFEEKTSELVSWKGNPFLNPNFITNYQFTYSFNNALVISNTFSVTEGFFARILEVVDETSTLIVPQNMRRSTINGLSVSYALPVTDYWEMSAFLVFNRSTFEGEFDNTDIDITANIYNFRIQNSIKLPLGISMSLSGFYNSPFIWRGSIEIDKYYRIDAGFKKNFFEEKLQLRLTGADIFNTGSDFPYTGNYGGIDINGVYKSDDSRFGFGATYKFGNNNVKKQQRKGGLSDELDRISN